MQTLEGNQMAHTEEFTLKITLGNEAMQTREDIAQALKAVIQKLNSGRDGGYIMDENGNTVGEFTLA